MGDKDGKRKPHHWVGFDLGGTKMMAAVLDDAFKVRGRRRKRTRGDNGQPVGIDRIIETIRQALADAAVEADTVRGIGLGCPGPVDPTRGIVLEASNLGWRQVDLKKPLEAAFGVEAFVVNDVDAGVYAENRFGAARGARTVVGVFPGTGIGGGCVYNGEIIQGANISCMEIGHMHMHGGSSLCGCEQVGCLETVASRLAIAAEVAKADFRSQIKKQRPGTDLAAIRSGILATAIKAGDATVERIVRQAAEDIGIALANVIHLLAPDVVVLGGGLVEAMPDLFVETVARSARDRVMKSFRNTFQVVAAQLADDATVMGAAAWAGHRIDAA
ncbi:MAG: ROK family protein [Pirellulaceae bacterium]|jgi:glucokinase|nr:ROK family protein [Pirellulaceae bacterium]